MNMISCMPLANMLSWEPKQVCETLRSIGYDAIEVTLPFLHLDTWDTSYAERALQDVNDSGLKISEAAVAYDYVLLDADLRKKQIERAKDTLRLLAGNGVKTAMMFSGPLPGMKESLIVGRDISTGDAWKYFFEALDAILPVAEDCGIRIGIENVWGMVCDTFYANKFLLNHFKCDNLGVNLDVSHDMLYGITDVGFIVRQYGNKIFHTHIKDAVGVPEAGKFVFPMLGEGIVDWKAYFDAMREINYQGAYSIECEAWNYMASQLDGKYEVAAKISYDAFWKLYNK